MFPREIADRRSEILNLAPVRNHGCPGIWFAAAWHRVEEQRCGLRCARAPGHNLPDLLGFAAAVEALLG